MSLYRWCWTLAFGFVFLSASLGEGFGQAQQSAKQVFGAISDAGGAAPEVIGGYSNGCLAGALRLAPNGPGWQAMRPSRNRAYGHPDLVAFVERLAQSSQAEGWPGLLVGDMAQPRGGPMLTGHRSHQTGIDVDIWFRPAPKEALSTAMRETLSATQMVARNRLDVTSAWTGAHGAIVQLAAEDAAVARIFVNAAIKRRLCADAPTAPQARAWLRKVRPWWGHDHHFHVRLHCPTDSPQCSPQDPPPPGDGCDDLAWWFSDDALHPTSPKQPRKELKLADLPDACRRLVEAQ